MRSELLALRGLSDVTHHDGYAVQVTPEEPDYWVGNQIIVTDPQLAPEAAERAFEQHFPKAKHRAIVWDDPDVSDAGIRAYFEPLGYEMDVVDALALEGELSEAPMPDGIKFRALQGDADWALAHALTCEEGQEEGRTADSHAAYLARRNAARQGQIAAGLGNWFGAFEGDQLVAQMGMMFDQSVARYQSVETRASHRRRGICAALLRHVGLWALERAPKAQLVIVAEADSDAGRLYRRMGFVPAEQVTGVLRPGY